MARKPSTAKKKYDITIEKEPAPEVTDAMSIMIQTAARRNSGMIYPFPFTDEKKCERTINSLLRNKFVRRVRVEAIAQHHKTVRGVGPVNYVPTPKGLKAINW